MSRIHKLHLKSMATGYSKHTDINKKDLTQESGCQFDLI